MIRPGMRVKDRRLGRFGMIGIVLRLSYGTQITPETFAHVRWCRWADGSRRCANDLLTATGRYQVADLVAV